MSALPPRWTQLEQTTALLAQRGIAFHPRLVSFSGRVTSGLLLSQAIYWTRKLTFSGRPDGWFWKTQIEWQQETGLSRREQETARRTLIAHGVWQEELKGMPARRWYRVNLIVTSLDIQAI